MIIVKLGGSLYHSPLLHPWLVKLEQLSQQEAILIVPGGGPFADQVRQTQQQLRISDHYAHHMALLAMSQFGLLLLGLCPQAQPFYYPTRQSSTPQSSLTIWLPDSALLEQDIQQHWDVTSDSLALWLTQQLRPNKLSLLKHSPPFECSTQQLANQGILDKAFPMQYAQADVAVELFDVKKIADFTLSQPQNTLTL